LDEKMTDKENKPKFLDALFKPRTIGIYGASERSRHFVGGIKNQGFDQEKLYLINPKREELFDLKVYKTLSDVPEEEIDHLIITLGRDRLLTSLEDIFSRKKINTIHIFAGSLGEFDEEGVKIETEIRKMLDREDINTRLVGPNCMGVYAPGYSAYMKYFPPELGNIALIFQSGDLHTRFIKFGDLRYGLRFSRGVSIGNTIDIQISDVLQYLNNEEDTDIIGVYFEGFSNYHPKEGRKLFQILKTMKKPVLFMRGGETERGQAAVLTHTGTLGTKQKIWDAVYKQSPIIKVPSSLESLLDYTYLFYMYINKFKKQGKKFEEILYPKGKNSLVILWSGGFGILATDVLIKLGLNVPNFDGEIAEKLRRIYSIKVGSLSNPLDMPYIEMRKEYLEIVKAAISEDIDLIIMQTDTASNLQSENRIGLYANLLKIKEFVDSQNKVLILILYEYPDENRKKYYDMLTNDGFIVYPSIPRAVEAYLTLYEYGRKRNTFKILNKS
jgi:acyl-CoA synthetase (NDP forming)